MTVNWKQYLGNICAEDEDVLASEWSGIQTEARNMGEQ